MRLFLVNLGYTKGTLAKGERVGGRKEPGEGSKCQHAYNITLCTGISEKAFLVTNAFAYAHWPQLI